jgi:hypothetical protein
VCVKFCKSAGGFGASQLTSDYVEANGILSLICQLVMEGKRVRTSQR